MAAPTQTPPLPGDLIFKESLSQQAKAIKEITGSRYTHCGVIVKRDGALHVAEAINPVRVVATPGNPVATVEEWVAQSIDKHAVIKRVGEGLTADQLERLETQMRGFQARPYDVRFQWDDNAIYCSEFIHDSFQRALGIVLGRVQSFRDFPMDGPLAQELILERYTRQNIPFNWEEQIITPVSVMNDPQLRTVLIIDHGAVQPTP